MANHTPGPWRVQTLFYKSYIRSVANDDELVATVETEADAPLIAAAPELLEICEEVLRQPGNSGCECELASCTVCGPDKLLGRMRRIVAVAKIEGKETKHD